MFRRMVTRLGHRPWFSAVGSRLLPGLDRVFYRLSRGRWMVTTLAFPTLLLDHGGSRPVPLLFARDGDGYLIAATNWGKVRNPVWSSRLLEHRRARIEIRGRSIPIVAQRLTPAEIEAAWPRLLAVWPAFETYRNRSGREIRVFRLEPAGGDTPPWDNAPG